MITEAQVQQKIQLRYARAELGFTQRQLADLAGVSEKTVNSAEQGKSIQALKAAAILKALNAARTNHGLDSLNFSDLDWRVQGK